MKNREEYSLVFSKILRVSTEGCGLEITGGGKVGRGEASTTFRPYRTWLNTFCYYLSAVVDEGDAIALILE